MKTKEKPIYEYCKEILSKYGPVRVYNQIERHEMVLGNKKYLQQSLINEKNNNLTDGLQNETLAYSPNNLQMESHNVN